MEKIDYEAIVESLWNTEEVMKDIEKHLPK